MTKNMVAAIVCVVAGVLFLVGAIQAEPADFENVTFDLMLGLTVLAFGTALYFFPGN